MRAILFQLASGVLALLAAAPVASAKYATHVSPAVEAIQKSSENQIHRLVEPLLEKYCRDQCKLLSVAVTADITIPEETAPGFDEVPAIDQDALAPTSATAKILFDEKLGPVSRSKLLDLVQQYLDTLDYPVRIDSQTAHFPNPAGSESRIAEMREKLAKNFQNTMAEVIQQYCPDQCVLTDFNLKTDVVNAEETQYGSPGDFIQEGNLALRIRGISATMLMDEGLTVEERTNILEMARLRTTTFHNAEINPKTIKFPKPAGYGAVELGPDGKPILGADGKPIAKNSQSLDSKNSTDSKASSLTDNKESNSSTSSSSAQQDSKSSTSSDSKANSTTTKTDQSQKQEKFERFEKIERVENGDAVQVELKKFKIYALIFGCSIMSLLIFIAMAGLRGRKEIEDALRSRSAVSYPSIAPPPPPMASDSSRPDGGTGSMDSTRLNPLAAHYEISRLTDDLLSIFAQNPKVAKYVFSRIITEEGIEVTAQYMHIFGETVMVEMLRDPSLQSDMNELMEFYARTPVSIDDKEKLELLRKLHQRTVSGKLAVMGNRSSTLFDFLAEMDGIQILEMIRTESLTVKSIILTQCDTQKRTLIYSHLDEETRLRLLTELSRIDYLPRDYIFNVAAALKRKRRENPRLNTEALPGSEVLVSLLERTNTGVQRDVVKNLEASNPESARTVKGKLVSIETLRYLRDGQLLEVVLTLRHDELLQFLKGCSATVKQAIFDRSPPELSSELSEELATIPAVSREGYFAIERKILNRMKLMANDGLINLVETNERMFSEPGYGGETSSKTAITGTMSPPNRRSG